MIDKLFDNLENHPVRTFLVAALLNLVYGLIVLVAWIGASVLVLKMLGVL